MGDPSIPPSATLPRRSWVAGLSTPLCLIAWVAAILTEQLPPSGIESLCLLVGCQAAALGNLTCLLMGLRIRVLPLVFLATVPPAAYFTLVLHQFARLGQSFH